MAAHHLYQRFVDRLLGAALLATAALVPLFVLPTAKESFREPKALLALLAAVILAVLLCWWWAVGGALALPRRIALLACAALAWTAATAFTSTNPALSWRAFASLAAPIVLFTGTWTWLSSSPPSDNPLRRRAPKMRPISEDDRSRGDLILLVTVAVALMVAVTAILQAFELWSPFQFDPSLNKRARVTSFLGNANDVGGWLTAPALLSLGAAITRDGAYRVVGIAVFITCATAMLATAGGTTLLSLIIPGAWIIARGVIRGRKIIAATGIVALVLIAWFGARESRLIRKFENIRSTNVTEALEVRRLAWSTATEMFRDHLLVGVGPGAYGFNYMKYKVRAVQHRPEFQARPYRIATFGEVHNDFLQVAAETGIPGLLLLLGGFFVFLNPGTAEGVSTRARFARTVSAPLALALAIQMVTNFPLHLAAVVTTYVLVAGVLLSWRTL